MPDSSNALPKAAAPAPKRTRRTQERTEQTRAKLIAAATTLFAERGYEGVSVRDIENAAEVQRSLLAYHFGDKESLWKLAADATFSMMADEFYQREELLKDLSERDRLAYVVRFYVRFHARHPELSRLMSQEARQDTWRIRYLIERHIRPAAKRMQALVEAAEQLDEQAFISWYYIMVSASSTIFSFAPECQLLFGVDSREEQIVEAHANMLVKMLC